MSNPVDWPEAGAAEKKANAKASPNTINPSRLRLPESLYFSGKKDDAQGMLASHGAAPEGTPLDLQVILFIFVSNKNF
jgi:hypothetical protein